MRSIEEPALARGENPGVRIFFVKTGARIGEGALVGSSVTWILRLTLELIQCH